LRNSSKFTTYSKILGTKLGDSIDMTVLLAFENAITRGIIGENEVRQERHEQF
jgi:hypothetical protein